MQTVSRNNRVSLQRALAATLVSRPNCTLNDLARSAGISRATLYRFAPTREDITAILMDLGMEHLESVAQLIDKSADRDLVLERVSTALLENWELVMLVFSQIVMLQQSSDDLNQEPDRWVPIGRKFENYFLEGQKAGVFRVEFTAAWLTDFYWTCFYGVSWAMSRGRLAPALAVSTLLTSFRHGASSD
ncbi:TetR/AcrR family transcriptional regulator [Stenotrophomonas maltophilia]|uniref:TetR/AcrR family transcriptional regulator n=1 Tax=Stenotrophomonas maltophilia TaxID=40324 RepID=A0A431UDE4_STEMA|nr:TetR/AcrR family transcriptional regulator [Stenotrophomonas maltophilia]